jgi:K+-sensing histidine kinase KdpD
LNLSNARRAFREERSDRVRKGNDVSTLEERRQIRDPTASQSDSSAEASSNRRYAPWKELVGANAPQLVAAVALVCVATVALVVTNCLVQLSFVPLIYVVPVVIGAARWETLAANVAAAAGAIGCDG